MNIARKNLQRLLDTLPALRNPTISNLSQEGWVAVETIIDEHIVRELIPALKTAGAEGIIEYPLNKVVYWGRIRSQIPSSEGPRESTFDGRSDVVHLLFLAARWGQRALPTLTVSVPARHGQKVCYGPSGTLHCCKPLTAVKSSRRLLCDSDTRLWVHLRNVGKQK